MKYDGVKQFRVKKTLTFLAVVLHGGMSQKPFQEKVRILRNTGITSTIMNSLQQLLTAKFLFKIPAEKASLSIKTILVKTGVKLNKMGVSIQNYY